MKNRFCIKVLSFLLAGAMAVGTVGASVSFDTAIAAEASSSNAMTLISNDMRGLAPFCPTMGIISSVLGNIATLTGGDPVGNALKQINDNINQLRAEMKEQYKALNSRIDENTKIIVDAIGNKLAINDAGVRLTELAKTVSGISDQINTDISSTKKTDEQKKIAVAKQIMNYQQWNKADNFIHTVSTVGGLLAGTTLAELNSKDFYTAVYLDCRQNVMFSGEAYDLAEPYIDRVMDEYYHAYAAAMQCLQAVKDVAGFTDEQTAALSAQDYKDYLDLAADAEQAEAKMEKLTEQLFDLDDPDSVGSHYLAFKYRKLHDRNVFVDHGHANIPISPEIAVLEVKADVQGDGNTFNYEDYKSAVNKVKETVDNEIKAVIGKSTLDSAKINDLYEYVKAAYPDKSFCDYLDYVGISGTALKGLSEVWFPISGAVSEGSVLKHNPKEEPGLKGDIGAITDIIGRDDFSKYINIGIKTFDHTRAGSDTADRWFYMIENWYTGYFFTSDYGYEPWKQERSMLVFQKADPLNVPAKGSDIVEQLRSEGVYDYTLSWSTANTWRYSVGKRAFRNDKLYVYDYFGNQVDASCVFEAKETPADGIDITGSTASRMVINAARPGEYHFRWKYTNDFGDTFYSKWITYAAFDPEGRITADASGWSRQVTLGVYELDKLINVSVLGTNGQPVNASYTFEAKEPCIQISGSKMTVHDFGTFHIRAKTVNANGKEICSDWVTFKSLSGAPDGFNVLSYLMYYADSDTGRKETPVNLPTDLDTLFRLKVVYEAGALVLNSRMKALWELKELPEKSCCIRDGKYFYAGQPGVYHVRAVNYEYNIVTDWFEIKAVSYGDDSEPESFEFDPQYVQPDGNTSFIIRQSYTGLVGAEPDSIEQQSIAEQTENKSGDDTEHPAHKRLMVDAIDGISGREIRVHYTWEAQETDGISLTEEGTVTFSKAGKYHVRVNSGEYSSEWFEISAVTESKEYATIAFCDEDYSLIKSITLPWGTEIDPPADPVKAGYTFAGWSQAVPERMPADDITLYAVWTKKGEPAESKPDKGGGNPNTGKAAAGMLAAAAAAFGAMAVIKKKKS